jgi:uncharacterized membrane protein
MPRSPHLLLVQFPLALFAVSFVFDVLSLRHGATWARAARFDLALGLVATLPAAVTGARDYVRRLAPRSPARRLGRWHAAANALGVALFACSLLARRGPLPGATPELPFVLSALAVAVEGVAGYLGGVLMWNLSRATRSARSRRVHS